LVKGYGIYERRVRVVAKGTVDIEKISGRNAAISNVWGRKQRKSQELNNVRIYLALIF
jgi:hypothetical protein